MSWIFYAVLGLMQVSLLMTLYKVPASKNINKYSLSFLSYLFGVVFAAVFFFSYINVEEKAIIYSLLWGFGYAVLTLVQMHVLHKKNTSEVFPFTSLASNILVVLTGFYFFHEYLSLLQWFAVIISAVMFVYYFYKDRLSFPLGILVTFSIISLLSTSNKVVQKLGSGQAEVHNFIFWQLVFAFVASAIAWFVSKRGNVGFKLPNQNLFFWSFLIGLFQFGSTFAITKALSLGPISLVYVILGLYTFMTSIFAAILFKEKITSKNIAVIAISIIIVFLIKFG